MTPNRFPPEFLNRELNNDRCFLMFSPAHSPPFLDDFLLNQSANSVRITGSLDSILKDSTVKNATAVEFSMCFESFLTVKEKA